MLIHAVGTYPSCRHSSTARSHASWNSSSKVTAPGLPWRIVLSDVRQPNLSLNGLTVYREVVAPRASDATRRSGAYGAVAHASPRASTFVDLGVSCDPKAAGRRSGG